MLQVCWCIFAWHCNILCWLFAGAQVWCALGDAWLHCPQAVPPGECACAAWPCTAWLAGSYLPCPPRTGLDLFEITSSSCNWCWGAAEGNTHAACSFLSAHVGAVYVPTYHIPAAVCSSPCTILLLTCQRCSWCLSGRTSRSMRLPALQHALCSGSTTHTLQQAAWMRHTWTSQTTATVTT